MWEAFIFKNNLIVAGRYTLTGSSDGVVRLWGSGDVFARAQGAGEAAASCFSANSTSSGDLALAATKGGEEHSTAGGHGALKPHQQPRGPPRGPPVRRVGYWRRIAPDPGLQSLQLMPEMPVTGCVCLRDLATSPTSASCMCRFWWGSINLFYPCDSKAGGRGHRQVQAPEGRGGRGGGRGAYRPGSGAGPARFCGATHRVTRPAVPRGVFQGAQ